MFLAKYNQNDKVKEDMMRSVCSTRGREEKENLERNREVLGKLTAYFLLIRHGPHRKQKKIKGGTKNTHKPMADKQTAR
jgi:hypothetical protein